MVNSRGFDSQACAAGLVPGWVTICGRISHLGTYQSLIVNSASHPSGVGKSSTSLFAGVSLLVSGGRNTL